jgi:glycerate kinase
MKILAALNAFKESPDNVVNLNNGLAETLQTAGHTVEISPIADGGDGTIDAISFHINAQDQEEKISQVKDPLGRDIQAKWLHLPPKKTAIIEMAKASGLSLVAIKDRNPFAASSYGTGQLIQAALDEGCKNILVTLGGSATIDAGMGMLKALGAVFKDIYDNELTGNGADLGKVASINLEAVKRTLGQANLIFLCDGKLSFLPQNETERGVVACAIQKFNNPDNILDDEMQTLKQGVHHYTTVVDAMAQRNSSQENYTGAAGGLAYTSVAALIASAFNGFEHLSKMFSLEDQVKATDLVITGEGRLDQSSFEGKAPGELVRLAKKHGKKVIFLCGSMHENLDWRKLGIDLVIPIKPPEMGLPEAIKKTLELIKNAVQSKLKEITSLVN